MNEIGELFKVTREEAGVSLDEASNDLGIKTLVLENIEDGNIGCFKDIFNLKENISSYAKYLGLNSTKIIDEFNEYLFEYTSKIPLTDIEKAMKEQKKEEIVETKIVSPYTAPVNVQNNKKKIIIGSIVIIIALIVIVWAVYVITVNNTSTNMISYVRK